MSRSRLSALPPLPVQALGYEAAVHADGRWNGDTYEMKVSGRLEEADRMFLKALLDPLYRFPETLRRQQYCQFPKPRDHVLQEL